LLGAGVAAFAAQVIALVIWHRLGRWEGLLTVALPSFTVAINMAERRGKVKSIKELNRPLTLFPPE
jgi:hypothetical protein